MTRNTKALIVTVNLLLAWFMLASPGFSKKKKPLEEPPFQYAAGTEDMEKGCAGKLEVLRDGFTFKCSGGTITLPYAEISLMQYRPDVSAKVLDMKVPWKVAPLFARVRENKYFTIVANQQGKLHVVIFKVNENDMRPYFAEIELASGKTVQEYRDFGEFN